TPDDHLSPAHTVCKRARFSTGLATLARSERAVRPQETRRCARKREVLLGEVAQRDRADAEQTRPDVRPDHRTDLRDEDRSGAEYLPPALDESRALVRRLDVRDPPAVGAVALARAEVVDEPLEGAPGGPHPLDRRDLGLDRQDRLDP